MWLLSERLVDSAGHVVNSSTLTSTTFIPAVCHRAAVSGDAASGDLSTCLTAHGYRTLIVFQPDSRFWTFQGIESALFVALAALLVAFSYRRVIRRDA